MEQQNNYRNYEYMTVSTGIRNANETADRYSSLGWEIDGRQDGLLGTMLTFKRDRNIKGKEQLNRLQARIEDNMNGIRCLEESKKRGSMIFALALGIIAALIFGGGMSLIMFNAAPVVVWAIITGVGLGVIGAGLAGINYPIFNKLVERKTAKINPVIEKKRDEIFDLCQEAHGIAVAA